MTQKSRATYQAALTTRINDNSSEDITPQDVREELTDVTDSAVFLSNEWQYAKKGPSPVIAASTANITVSTLYDGDSVDGVTVSTGDRVLLKDQSTASENGIYVILGVSTSPTRATDFNSTDTVFLGSEVYVEQGTANAKSTWVLTAPTGTITVGTSNLTFQRYPLTNGTTNDGIITYNSSTGEFQVESNATFDGTTLTVTGIIAIDNIILNSSTVSHSANNGSIELRGGSNAANSSIFINGSGAANPYDIVFQDSLSADLLRWDNSATNWDFNGTDVIGMGDVTIDDGLVVGSPTGGNKGTGTINATAVYDDNVLLTDYVFESEYLGSPKDKKHAEYKRKSLDEEKKHVKEKLHLSTIIGREEWETKGKSSTGQLINQIWETVETQFLYIVELQERIKKLEEGI